jgi:hypothetical protein
MNNDQITRNAIGRRSFMKRVGLAGLAAAPLGVSLSSGLTALAQPFEGPLTAGDTAILRFLAAAELIEGDLWQQYSELALGNESYQLALNLLDGDEATYVELNNRDELSHSNFLNAYLKLHGRPEVNLDQFRTLPSSQATGVNKQITGRLTNLMNLTVDTSWYFRYREAGNPDLGGVFPQLLNLVNAPAIPISDLPSPVDSDGNPVASGFQIQFIAFVAGWHFAAIEQGGASLYQSFLPKATSPQVLEILGAIGGSEIQHFQTWQDKAGNALEVIDPNNGTILFPQLPLAPALPNPPDGTDNADPSDTNQIFPFPCEFISANLPPCAVIRPSSTAQGGAQAAIAGFTASGLFDGQSQAFFTLIDKLAKEADAARRM